MAPSFSYQHLDPDGQPSRSQFSQYGALISIELRLAPDDATMRMIRTGGTGGTSPGLASIDTGAAVTSVDEAIIHRFDLQPVDEVLVSTPVGVHRLRAYALRLLIPSVGLQLDLPSVPAIDLAGATYQRQEETGPIIALIGRDVLTRCAFAYDGPQARFTLTREDV